MNDSLRAAQLIAVGICCFAAGRGHAQAADRGEMLEQLVVYGARRPMPADRSGSAVTLLGREQIQLDGRLTVGELLRGLPGVALSRSGGQGALTQLRMRGGEANHVAVFVDGVKVNDPSQSSEFDFANLLSDGLERVEVIRGPQSALWGSDALSGVVNIISARPGEGLSASATAESGSANWQRLSGSVSAAGSRGHFTLNAGRVGTDGYNVSRSGNERDGYENTSFALAGGFDLSHAVTLATSLRSIDSQSDFDSTDFSTGLPADSLDTLDKQQIIAALRLTAHTHDGRWQHDVRFDRLDTENFGQTENAFAASGFDFSRSDATVNTFAYQSSFLVTDTHRLTGAIEHRDEAFVQRGPVIFGDPNRDEQMETDAIVIEYDVRPTQNLAFLVSWRKDENSHFNDAATKRISGTWSVGESGTRLRAAYGEGVKNPTFTERFGFFTDFIGNPTLMPERSRSAEFGIDRDFAVANLRISATLFYDELEDEINGFVFDPVLGGFTSANQHGKSDRRGFEFESAWSPRDALAMQFAWTVLDAEEFASLDGPLRELRRPERTANLRMQWRAIANRLNLAFNFSYSSEQDDFFFPPVPPFQERVTLDGFSLATLSAEYEVAQALQVFGRVENALNDDYEEVFGFRGNGRQIFVGFRYRR